MISNRRVAFGYLDSMELKQVFASLYGWQQCFVGHIYQGTPVTGKLLFLVGSVKENVSKYVIEIKQKGKQTCLRTYRDE